MTTCDHRMNLPCDAVTVLIICALIYAIRHCIPVYELLLLITCTVPFT